VAEREEEPPYEGGSQPVEEHPTGVEGGGRGGIQTVVVVLGVLVVLAALAWFLVPLLGGS
jgi:hypothetical protein